MLSVAVRNGLWLYQARTLSDVEKQYLASLKIVETTVKKEARNNTEHSLDPILGHARIAGVTDIIKA